MTDRHINVLGLIVSTIVAGLVGYFSARLQVQSEISSLSQKIALVNNDLENQVRPALQKLDTLELALQGLNNELSGLRNRADQTELVIEIFKDRVELELTKARNDTIEVLEALIRAEAPD